VEAVNASLLADVAVAIFRSGFDRWVDSPDGPHLAARIREAGLELTGAITPLSPSRPGRGGNHAEQLAQ
jgi:hypothetical protein